MNAAALELAPRWLAGALIVLCLAYGGLATQVHPSLNPDSAIGFLVQRSVAGGAPWNHLKQPAAANLANDEVTFIAAWSPGQYEVAAPLLSAGLGLGDAVRIICIVVSLVGISGWIWLFRTLGHSWTITLAAGVLIAASRNFAVAFLTYPGGDLLSFAAFPFLALAVYALRESAWTVPVYPLVIAAGFYVRSSLVLYLAAWMASVVIGRCLEARPAPRLMAAWIASAAAAGVTVLAIQRWYLERGWTLLEYVPAARLDATVIAPFAMPWLTATSLDGVLSRLLLHPARPLFDYHASAGVLLPVAIAGAALSVWDVTRSEARASAVACLGFVVVLAAIFAGFVATGSTMDLAPARHYVIPAAVASPFVVRWLVAVRPAAIRLAVIAVVAVCSSYGVSSFASNWLRHVRHESGDASIQGLTYPQLSRRMVLALQVLDRELPEGNGVVVLPQHEYALELRRARVLSANVTSLPVADVAGTQYHGVVDNIVFVTENRGMTADAVNAWLGSFVDYHGRQWESFELDGHRFHTPVGQPVNAAWLSVRLTSG